MSDELLPYYARELAILRTLAGDFAQQHPKIAGRLSLGREVSQDPHVERLLQGVAFLTAGVQKRLDDDYPQLTDGLLDLLYPHYLRPVPSMTIVEMAIDRKQSCLLRAIGCHEGQRWKRRKSMANGASTAPASTFSSGRSKLLMLS